MVAVPIKPEYGPTLGRLLSPRWRAVSRGRRMLALFALGSLVALLLAAGLTLENPSYSQGGKMPFSFSYRNLYRVRAGPGEYVKIQRHGPGRVLEDSFAVEPLQLPRYSGALSAELPVFATGYIRELTRRYSDFVLRGEGKTKVNGVAAYAVMYTARVNGQMLLGRDVLLVGQGRGQRDGVDIVMLTAPNADPAVTTPLEVATNGVLVRPLKTFTLG